MVMIAIVIFGIINLAPGNPGQATNASGSERADQNANSREGFRLFKEHYNLDKPIWSGPMWSATSTSSPATWPRPLRESARRSAWERRQPLSSATSPMPT
jgi:hypothetical protein